ILPPNTVPEVDIILCQSRFAHYRLLKGLNLNKPMVTVEFTAPFIKPEQIEQLKSWYGDIHVFNTKWGQKAWNCDDKHSRVIEHGISTPFPHNPTEWPRKLEKISHILTVANDYI